MIEHTDGKNCLTVVSDPIPHTDFESRFHFPHHCRIRYFRRFISISSHQLLSQ